MKKIKVKSYEVRSRKVRELVAAEVADIMRSGHHMDDRMNLTLDDIKSSYPWLKQMGPITLICDDNKWNKQPKVETHNAQDPNAPPPPAAPQV
jgi:hypothetical protein